MRRLVALPPAERLLVLRALLVVAAVRLGLWLLPPAALLRRVERSVGKHAGREPPADLPATRVAWAVRAASRRIPGASCLTQAVAARLLLARYGHHALLRIGVRRDERGGFEAHAWAEVDGWPVVGGRDVGHYRRLPDLVNALRWSQSEGGMREGEG